ncbi:hypothetical protein AB205_0173890, partial [Aquarana catesbeiana]
LLLPTVGVSWGTLGVATWSQLQPSPSSPLEALVNTCWLLDSAPQGILCSNPGGFRVGVPAPVPSLHPDSHPQQSAVGSTALRCTPDPNGVHLSPSLKGIVRRLETQESNQTQVMRFLKNLASRFKQLQASLGNPNLQP